MTIKFPVYIDKNGQYDDHSVAHHSYAADTPFIDPPREARYYYAKRFGIEVMYRLSEQSIAAMTTQNPAVRGVVRLGESALTEHLVVFALRICGDAPLWRASPLVIVI